MPMSSLTPEDESPSIRHVLRLFVTGMTPRSIVDIYQHPEAARLDQIVATPTLIKRLPPSLKRLVSDLSDRRRVLLGLNIRET